MSFILDSFASSMLLEVKAKEVSKAVLCLAVEGKAHPKHQEDRKAMVHDDGIGVNGVDEDEELVEQRSWPACEGYQQRKQVHIPHLELVVTAWYEVAAAKVTNRNQPDHSLLVFQGQVPYASGRTLGTKGLVEVEQALGQGIHFDEEEVDVD